MWGICAVEVGVDWGVRGVGLMGGRGLEFSYVCPAMEAIVINSPQWLQPSRIVNSFSQPLMGAISSSPQPHGNQAPTLFPPPPAAGMSNP